PIFITLLHLSTVVPCFYFSFFFFNDTATTEIYTLSLHDALPISHHWAVAVIDLGFLAGRGDDHWVRLGRPRPAQRHDEAAHAGVDRKSTRLNSSHVAISYAVFCLKKKNNTKKAT